MVVNTAEFFLSHRLPVALAARDAGWEVHVATEPGAAAACVEALGFVHHGVPFQRGGLNPVRDLQSLVALARLFRRVRPDVVHCVTIKPVIWGGIAGRLTGVPARVAAVSGLGWVFLAPGWRARVLRTAVRALYRLALGGAGQRTIFQNTADRDLIARPGGALARNARIVRGSGVDLTRFRPAPEPGGRPVVLFPARLLLDKGLREFVKAARALRDAGVAADFVAAGDPDPANPASVPEHELAAWKAEGIVRFPGHVTDMAAVLAASHLVVLPSYREGLPKALAEAAAAGRPVVTTDTPGCRDAIVPGETGLLVPVGAVGELADAMRRLITDPALRRAMGAAGRRLAEDAFDERAIAARHLEIYGEILPARRA